MLAALAMAHATAGRAEESSQPYIDLLRQGLPAEEHPAPPAQPGVPDPYIQSIRKEQVKTEEPPGAESYIDQLRATDPEAGKAKDTGSYTEREQQRLGGRKETGGAIQAVADGKSELKPRKEGQPNQTAGFRLAAANNRVITVSPEAGTGRKFSDVYGSGWAPELMLSYEYQPVRIPYVGNLGIVAAGGFSYFSGDGQFEKELFNPITGASFGRNSLTKFKLVYFPMEIGARFTLTTGRYIQPYAEAGGMLVYFQESRTDAKALRRGNSKGAVVSGGVNILLDFLFPRQAWDLYSDFTVKHYYLTLDFTRTAVNNGDLQFNNTLGSVGFTYEF